MQIIAILRTHLRVKTLKCDVIIIYQRIIYISYQSMLSNFSNQHRHASSIFITANISQVLLWELLPQCVPILAVKFWRELKTLRYWLLHQSRGCYQPMGNRHVGDNVTLSRDSHALAQKIPIAYKHTGTFSLVGKFPTRGHIFPTLFSVGNFPTSGNWGIYHLGVIGKRTHRRNNAVVIIPIDFSYDFSQCVPALSCSCISSYWYIEFY